MDLRTCIAAVDNFPKPGITFRDITPLLANPAALRQVIDYWVARFAPQQLDAVLGIESRGFIFAAALAQRLDCGLIPVRKPGKLPRATYEAEYALEYGTDRLQIHRDAVRPGARVIVVDDLMATGGTARAAVSLAQRCGAAVLEVAVLIELMELQGRAALQPVPVHSLVAYEPFDAAQALKTP